jgi:hypothetical protein
MRYVIIYEYIFCINIENILLKKCIYCIKESNREKLRVKILNNL